MAPHLRRHVTTPGNVVSGKAGSDLPRNPTSHLPDHAGRDARGTASGNDGPLQVVSAGAGDHVEIHRFLTSVFHAPTAAEFQAQLEAPGYETTDRLLIKRGGHIVSHLRMTYRLMRFGPLEIPACVVSDVATLPEYRCRGYASALLREAHRRMQRDGVRLALLRTYSPAFYARHGWVVGFRHSYCTAGARDLLAALPAEGGQGGSAPEPLDLAAHATPPAAATRPALTVRLWRHVEQDALMRLYEQDPIGRFGPPRRDDAYWRWLISRRGYDRIYVAIEGPDRMQLPDRVQLEEAHQGIVGYAVLREGRIVELVTAEGCPRAMAALVQRAGMDAIEHDDHALRLDAAPHHPLRQAFLQAGGALRFHEADQGLVHMIRLFRPLALLAQLFPLLVERARDSQLELPCELGLLLDDQKHRLVITRRSAKVLPEKLGRSYLKMSASDLPLLLLGHLDIDEAVDAGRVTCSTSVARDTARILWPRLPLWLPPWDDLPATF